MRRVAPDRGNARPAFSAFLIGRKTCPAQDVHRCPVGLRSTKENPMLDAVMLAIGLAFFALSVGYVLACDRL